MCSVHWQTARLPPDPFFAIQVLGNIVFLSALVSLLYYIGILGFVVKWIGKAVGKLMGTSEVESFVAVANMFLGQTDSPILVSKYLGQMTDSEVMVVLVSGMGSMSVSILGGYTALGIPMEYLLIASTLVPVGSIMVAKMLLPQTEEVREVGSVKMDNKGNNTNVIEAVAEGAVTGMQMALSIGAALYLIPGRIRRNIREIADYYQEEGITVTFLPPHMAMKYMAIDQESPLRILLSGSEPVRNLDRRPYDLINVYASSEACALISYYRVRDKRKSYPIGRVVSALRYYIVDEEGAQVAGNEPGELWISGPQVTRGYRNMPELNRERFCPNPFCGEAPYDRVFKTGDMVAAGKDGELVYLGRRDNMVKIRGFRVELAGVGAVHDPVPGDEGGVLRGAQRQRRNQPAVRILHRGPGDRP